MYKMNTYLGNKGYTILKSELSVEQQSNLKKDLLVKPHVHGAPAQTEIAFPVYRESAGKIYVPHYYGVDKFGTPKEVKVADGDNIDLTFNGELRENQKVVVDTYLAKVGKQGYGGGLLELPCAYGKCLGFNTEILMYDGTIKKVQDIVVGDRLMGDDSTPRNVLTLARGREQMYRISSKKGDSYTCNESHILSLKFEGRIIDISVADYLQQGVEMLGYKVLINFVEKEQAVNVDPYESGLCRIVKQELVCNSKQVRIDYFNGFVDSCPNRRTTEEFIELPGIDLDVIDSFVFLARSLGHSAYKNGKSIFLYNCGLEYELIIEKLGIDDYYGFEIDGNRRFVLADFTVTHNTVLALNIIAQLQKKTFIIVHKEFLMNQWIERINQFLPGARIGKIQGQIVDTDNKDIVIGMLQSLSQKEYPASMFDSFGLTIIDEVHHISSEVFSRSLFKIVTKYMLGLSATMNRKDGTTKVFKMFLGEVVFKGKRDDERNVIVRAIDYFVDDDEFNHVPTDFRGNPAYSTLISKLCDYNRRSEFILKVLTDLLEENPNQQIMILAHNKSLLKYFFTAIEHRNIATVGYYVGGMKEAALKLTETKQVVIATYSMAAEALDIKTLTTLIMATPKTDIEQSVGRILREKHSNPIVVDIIDSHSIFQNQWAKRKTFYNREKYRIIHTTNQEYNKCVDQWVCISKKRDPDKALEGKCFLLK